MAKHPKRILYIDASGYNNNTQFKISLYDPAINLTNILALNDINTSNVAEKYAILYSIFYCVKNNLKNVYILCDNQSAVDNKKLQELASLKSIKLLWIPREINTIADRVSKLEPTVKEKEWFLLDYLYKCMMI